MLMGRPVVKSWARPNALFTSSIYCPTTTLPSSFYSSSLHTDRPSADPPNMDVHFAVLGSIIGEDHQPKAIRLVRGAYYTHNTGQCLLFPQHRSIPTMPTPSPNHLLVPFRPFCLPMENTMVFDVGPKWSNHWLVPFCAILSSGGKMQWCVTWASND